MVSLIVCSYDGYSDCWEGYFKLLKKYFPEAAQFEIILSTTGKIYELEGLPIKTIVHSPNDPWGKRTKACLEQAKYDLVMPMSEDYFLKSPVNFDSFKYFYNLMKENEKIDYIRLLRYNVRWTGEKSEFNYLERIDLKTKHRFLLIPGIWKKTVINRYLKNYENVFMSEKISGFRSWIYKDGFYSISEDYVEKYGQLFNTDNSGFVFKGKWVPWQLDFLKKEGIEIDLKRRGVLTDEFAKKTRFVSKINILKDPLNSSKSFLSVLNLWMKQMFNIN